MDVNRCAGAISDACTSELARLIRIAGNLELDRLTFRSSLKYGILYDPALSVTILSQSSFEVCELAGGVVRSESPALAAARVSDFLLGAMRVRRQYETLLGLREITSASAWLVVTAYYCAFFSVVEICKLFDRISASFTKDDLEILAPKAAGIHHAAFFQAGHNNFVGQARAGRLIFSSIGTRPHAAAWQNALRITDNIFKKHGWLDASHYISLLEKESQSPSAIRNEWNYKRADYYGQLGETQATNFKKIIGNPKSAHSHLCQTRGVFADFDPSVIAILCEIFHFAVVEAAGRAGAIIEA